MKYRAFGLAVLTLLLASGPRRAAAQDAAPASAEPLPSLPPSSQPAGDPAPPAAPEGQPAPTATPAPQAPPAAHVEEEKAKEKEADDAAPPPHTGFQLSIRTGYSIPLGKATGASEDDMSNLFSGQVPLVFDVGGKVSHHVYLGGYLGFGFGGVAGQTNDLCRANGLDCSSTSVRGGANVQYHFIPGGTINPWIGYGLGLEVSGITLKRGGTSGSITATGLEFAQFMAGVDFRLSKAFGIGPFAQLSVGQFNSLKVEATTGSKEGDLEDKALHEWLTLGVRFVFLP